MVKDKCYIFCLLCFLLLSCNEGKKERGGLSTFDANEVSNEVEVITLHPASFISEIICNGKIDAQQKADLRFQTASQPIAVVTVKNGTYVKKGQVIAKLSTTFLETKLKQARNTVEQSKLEMKDVLIGQGYRADDTESIHENVLRLAQLMSGYAQSVAAYDMAKKELAEATLRAPFDGIIANLTAKPFSMSDASQPICRLLGTNQLSVEFFVMETELQVIHKGERVEVMPYAMPQVNVRGKITEINPLVDEKGLVKIKAEIKGNTQLLEGMNVRVRIQKDIPNQFVVPKTAIVLRSGRQVLFTYDDGKAVWNYVTTGLENLDSYTVTGENLKEGMLVIVSGGQNLAHHSPVKIVKSPKQGL